MWMEGRRWTNLIEVGAGGECRMASKFFGSMMDGGVSWT